jgi:hypothetical protein
MTSEVLARVTSQSQQSPSQAKPAQSCLSGYSTMMGVHSRYATRKAKEIVPRIQSLSRQLQNEMNQCKAEPSHAKLDTNQTEARVFSTLSDTLRNMSSPLSRLKPCTQYES